MHSLIKRNLKRSACGLAVIFRVALGVFLLWSSFQGIRRPYDFLGNVYEYELVGPKLGMLVAIIVPWLELMLGACLVGGILVGGALLASIVFLGASAVAEASVLYRGLSVSVERFHFLGSCVPKGHGELIGASVLLMVAMAAYAAFLLRRKQCLGQGPSPSG